MKKLGFLQKQLLVYSLLLTVAVMILIFWAHAYLMNISQENAAITQKQLTASTLNQIDAYLDQLMLIATQVAHDSELISTMEFLDRASNPKDENYFHHNANIEHLLSIHNALKDPVYRIEAFNLHRCH